MTTGSAQAGLPAWLEMGDQLTPEEYTQHEGVWLSEIEEHVNPILASGMRATGNVFVEWRGEGLYVYDPVGKQLFDCLGAGGVFGLGFRHPRVIEAVKHQLDRMPLSTRMGLVPAQGTLAKRLLARAPGDFQYVFFGNSGTESVEAALKLARVATGRGGLVGTTEGYHGMSTGTISLSGLKMWRDGVGPMLGRTRLVPHGSIEALEAVVNETTAAVVLEPIQWASGCKVPEPDYFPKVRELCDRTGALLILDEVQTGLGRTGYWFACEHWGVKADILCVGKVLSGGVVPISATLYTARVFEGEKNRGLFNNSSFGGNPLACTAGVAAMDVLEGDGLVERSRALGEQLEQGFDQIREEFPGIVAGQHGLGLMRCLEMTHPLYGFVFQEILRRDHSILVASMAHIPQFVRVSPPFICTDDDLAHLVKATSDTVRTLQEMGPEKVQAYFQEILQKIQAAAKAAAGEG